VRGFWEIVEVVVVDEGLVQDRKAGRAVLLDARRPEVVVQGDRREGDGLQVAEDDGRGAARADDADRVEDGDGGRAVVVRGDAEPDVGARRHGEADRAERGPGR